MSACSRAGIPNGSKCPSRPGAGLPDGARDKLGRVFYSTKPRGKGTGLGLVLAADAVRRLGGTLQFANRPGGGTRVDVRIPLAALGP